MNPEHGQNFIKNSEFQCMSVDGASAMNIPLHGIVSDFSDISNLDSTESLLTSGHDDTIPSDFFTDQCSMCHCVRAEDSDQEYPSDLSKVRATSFHEFLRWLCPTCNRMVEECKRAHLKNCTHSPHYDSCDEASANPHCPCINCQVERESTLSQKKEFQKIWSGVAEAISRVFNAECAVSVLSESDFLVLKNYVARLCQMNCHYLFKKLEKRCRQMVINMKVHILKKTKLQRTDSADMAYNFMSIILHKYTHLGTACEILADVLSPLVEQHMRQFNATWQLHNKYLFCCVIFNEPIVQKCLPEAADIIRQDLKKKQQDILSKEQEMLTKKYLKVLADHERFAKEMTDVSQFWKSCQQNIEKYDECYEIEKMKERKHCLGDGLGFIKKQRQLLKDIQGGCLLADAFDNLKRAESFEKLWILGRADETHCPNCRAVKCSYDEAGMSHLITCGIISPDIISEEGLSPTIFEKQEPGFQEYLNSASIRSTSSSSDDSFPNDPYLHKERSGDGVSSEEDDEDDDEDEEDDDEDDFHDAQQIHLPDFCPSIENASSELVNRCNQSFLLQQRDVVPDCSCIKRNKESLCLFSYNKKNPKHFLKFMLKANQNGEDDGDREDDDDEDYDIHEDGIHTSSDLEYSTMTPLTNQDLLLNYPNDSSSFSPKSIIENIMDCSGQSPFSQKQIVENNFGHRFLLPTLEQQCNQERNKFLRFRDRPVPPPTSSPIDHSMTGDDDDGVITSLEEPFNLSMNLNHCCAPKTNNSARSLVKIDHDIPRSPIQGNHKSDDANRCETEIQESDSAKNVPDKKSGKDRSTQHPEKVQSPGDKKPILTNYYQVSIKHPNSCQKQQSKATSQQKVGSGDASLAHGQQKQGSFTVPQQPAKQQPFRCQASSCNGHMVGAGDGGLDKEECDTSPHPHPPGCEGDDKLSGGLKDVNGKAHCECWHCEFFGHETQSNAPTSKNFAECRDRLRQKLKKKQSSTKSSLKSTIALSRTSVAVTKRSSPDPISGLKSVDELIDYINGGKTEQSGKERGKDSGTKKKTGKNKRVKENMTKTIVEDAPNDLTDVKTPISCLQHQQASNTPTAISIQLETKPRDESNGSEPKSRIHTVLISGTTVTLNSYSHSSLENSVPILKLNNSKKFEIPPDKERGDGKNESKDRQMADKGKKDHQKNGSHQDKSTSSPKMSRSNNEDRTDSAGSKSTLNLDLKSSLTPPPSPHFKLRKSDLRKAPEQNLKQRLANQKVEAKEMKENGSCIATPFGTSKQNKSSPPSGCLLNGTIETLPRSNGSCQKAPLMSNGCRDLQSVASNSTKSHASVGTSSPVSTSKNKKQKKRNKMCSDLSFEEIFKPNDEDDDLGEDDREIEEFKRFCFNTPPLPVREKLRVNLNVKDIFNRRKPPQSCNS